MPELTITITDQQEATIADSLSRGLSACLPGGTASIRGREYPIAGVAFLSKAEHAAELARRLVAESITSSPTE